MSDPIQTDSTTTETPPGAAKNEVLEKAGEVAKTTQQFVDQWSIAIQKGLASLGSYQPAVVVGILISFGFAIMITPALMVPPLALVVVTLFAKSFK